MARTRSLAYFPDPQQHRAAPLTTNSSESRARYCTLTTVITGVIRNVPLPVSFTD